MKNEKLTVGMIAAMPYPPHKACGIRVKNEIYSVDSSVNIRLYCAPPGRRHERHNNLEIIRIDTKLDTTNYYKYYSWKTKLKVDFSLAKRVAVDIKKNKIHLLHAHTPEGVFISILSRFLALKKVPIIADLHGPFVQELIHYKMIPNFFLFKSFFSMIESYMFFTADRIFCSSSGLTEYIKRKTKIKDKVVLFQDYVVLKNFANIKVDKKLAKSLNPEKKTMIMYAGTLKDYQGLDVLIKAFVIVLKTNQNLLLVVLGDGGLGVEYYKKMADNLKIPDGNIHFVGQVPHQEVAGYTKIADILVSSRKDTEVTKGGFVSQMPEYLAAGKVIVSTKVSDCGEMLQGGAGILVKSDSINSLAKGLTGALKDKENWKRYSRIALRRAKEYSWEENSVRLVKIYKEVANATKN